MMKTKGENLLGEDKFKIGGPNLPSPWSVNGQRVCCLEFW